MTQDDPESAARSVELVRLAQAGDREAMNRLIERYYDRVRPIVRARLGPGMRQRVDSVDILQETFLDAVRLLDRFEIRHESSLIQWLAKIAELRVCEEVRRMKAAKRDPAREVRLEDVTPSRALREPSTRASSPSAHVVRREEAERFEACLDQLREEYREVILLRDFAGASWEEVATELKRPSAAAARMMHSRALAELSSLYGRPQGQ